MRRALAILLVLVTMPLVAQESEWYVGQTIRDVRFVGLVSVNKSDLDPIIAPYIGQPFTNRGFLEMQRRLYALDYFTSLVPEALRPQSGDGVVLQFTVEERPTVDEIQVVGNHRVRTADILNEIVLKQGDMITLAKRRIDEQAVTKLYLERGYPDVKVSSRVDETDEGTKKHYALVFTIDEGQQVTVREILFSGNSFASASTLRGQMTTKAQSIFNSGVYQDKVLEADKLKIEDYYHQRGYVDAKVTNVDQKTERDEENNRSYLVLTIYIEEGSQYTFAGITFDGNTIFSDTQLGGVIRVHEGSVLNATRLQQGVAQAEDLYYQSGYIFNQFKLDEKRDEQALSIAYVLHVTEQPRAHIENIIVKGNKKTADSVILREIPLQVGDVFSVGAIRDGIQALNALQYFSAINPETPQGSAEGLMDLVINVEEAQTANINFGLSFGGSTEFPVSAQVGWSDSNFRGMGQTLGFQATASPIEQMLSLNFLEPWFMKKKWSLGADVTFDRKVETGIPQDILGPIFGDDDTNRVPDPYQGYYVFGSDPPSDSPYAAYSKGDIFPDAVTDALISEYDLVTDYEYAGGSSSIPDAYLMQYVNLTLSAGATTGYRFRTTLGTLSLSTSLRTAWSKVDYDANTYRPFDPDLRANYGQLIIKNTWGLTATLDKRQGQILSPTGGYAASQGVTFAGGFLFGDRHYIRTDSKAEAYLTLFNVPIGGWSWKTILAAHSEMSFILPTFWVPAAYRGVDGPIAGSDLLSTNSMFIGRGWDAITDGQALWNNWLELRMPIAEQVLWTDAFFDAVSIWDSPSQITTLGPENMRFGFGVGIRFTIPQFPIRLYLAKRFKISNDGAIEWQQGDLFNWNNSATGGLDFVFAIGADLF